MRLQLDSAALRSAENGSVQQTSGLAQNGERTKNGSRVDDSVGISGPSAALGRLAADRASRIQQLTVAVRSDTYQVPLTALSQSILAQANV